MSPNINNNNSDTPTRRVRSNSFNDIDEVQAKGILEDLIRDNNVQLGGSSLGKGFKKAAKTYLQQQQQQQLLSDADVEDEEEEAEEAFYVVDLGIIVSQVYQWRKYFPRVEPFYAVKCNPDPLIVQTLALLGCNFDCASQQEIQVVQQACSDLYLRRTPEIIYANPCKARAHLKFAVQQGVTLVTFDNVQEVYKCAKISQKIQLVLRIVTDDRGSQCRLSSKYGAPKSRWRNLLQAAKQNGLEVVGVSFHVGSGCRDARRYASALQDSRELFDIASNDYGFNMTILDIGGGFPGETHSFWNPEVLDEVEEENEEDEDQDSKEGLEKDSDSDHSPDKGDDTPYMFFMEIAEQVAPMIDELFPSPNVRVIGEPGRYFVAAAATLVTSVVGARSNELDEKYVPQPVNDAETSKEIFERSREEEHAIIRKRGQSFDLADADNDNNNNNNNTEVWDTITEELSQYAKYFTKQTFVTQETDAYNDGLDLYQEDFDTAADLLGVPDKRQMQKVAPSVEGMTKAIAVNDEHDASTMISLAAAGEAAVNGCFLQAVADSAPLQDDYAYYVNDGVYGAFNNLMFDHATVRPRVLKLSNNNKAASDQNLYASTVFGPTCDSIDVIARSVLLPKLKIGDWLYFQNMGAYTMAAASSFNGFTPTEKMYVCSVQPEYLEELIAGPTVESTNNDAAEANDKTQQQANADEADNGAVVCEEKKDDIS